MNWTAFAGGTELGTTGSEGGTIIFDEELGEQARITIERGGHTAPFSITCGVFGWMMHTRFFSTEVESRVACAEMQQAIGEMVTTYGHAMDQDTAIALCHEFLARFP